MKLAGLAAIAFFLTHETVHTLRGYPENGLWTCNVAVLAVGLGLLIPSPLLNSVGTFWLTAGFPLWIFYLFTASNIAPTTALSHIGGLAIGYAGLRKLGLPKSTWWVAIVALLALILVSRVVSSPEENINLSHGVYAPTGQTYSSYWLNMLFLSVIFTGAFTCLQWGLPRLGFRRA